MSGQDILWGISKVPFEIPHKISYPYIEGCVVHQKAYILELLDLKVSNRLTTFLTLHRL